ncbi:MAG: hypothetical protein IPJ75_00220 [Ignavibacteriales bacterium]|nr:hypothetical protein [Ignavibacteriales bacterium]
MKKAILLLTICFATLPVTVCAQYYYFGRNKVQYEDFDWRVLKDKTLRHLLQFREWNRLQKLVPG